MTEKTEEQLLIENLGLVFSQSSKFKPNRLSDKDDFSQAGILGLIKTIRKLDLSKGKLSTFSWIAIKNELISEAYKNNTKISNNEKNSIYKIATVLPITKDIEAETKKNIDEYLPDLNEEESFIISKKLEGYTNKEITDFLNITQSEFKSKLDNLYKKIVKANES